MVSIKKDVKYRNVEVIYFRYIKVTKNIFKKFHLFQWIVENSIDDRGFVPLATKLKLWQKHEANGKQSYLGSR